MSETVMRQAHTVLVEVHLYPRTYAEEHLSSWEVDLHLDKKNWLPVINNTGNLKKNFIPTERSLLEQFPFVTENNSSSVHYELE